ncbi:Ferredoxin-2 [Planktothrix tepida]|uniref:4Fe-4S ferredoxin, iron-sulfur binding domain protein n=1 Tax=Planktothrix tepida PCC 9214 TaxID=671072 RepID=A0A1J1LST1_9CYAN|nr:helix-turn-helix domain-containing protein [Planktothrix tepida]CAD5959016.1 Ferredoxin-2 [Planktothrix tepida]CUR34609.1 4Fe-4S ferredoxin, iron-sulfur binding domain protein [Planktothrix tepida PCC 9214]
MAYKIPGHCLACDTCRPVCPTGAVQIKDNHYWIDPNLCNNCEGYYSEPQCLMLCPISCPLPSESKKGRYKAELRPVTSPSLFANGKNHPFASSMVMWELCNLLTQRQSLDWKFDEVGEPYYERRVNGGRGMITLRMSDHSIGELALTGIQSFDIRAACMHLIYAAHATALEKPWEEEFIISDRQIEEYLELDKRKDLSKATKLSLIRKIAEQPCFITGSINWPKQGKVNKFLIVNSPLWHLTEVQHHFQEDEMGCKYLVGLTFKIKAGIWAKYFLNQQGCKEQTAFYQYGILPQSLLSIVMSIWQQHEGAVRMMLWLLFKTKMGKEQRITVPKLMRVAYGEEKLTFASQRREERKRLLRTFERDLECLNHYGLKPVFDSVTYPPEIQPLWAKLGELPDDADAALDFWIQDGSNETRITDASPRGKWNLLMNARILWFELPVDWEQRMKTPKQQQRGTQTRKIKLKPEMNLLPEQIVTARKQQGMSQRELARITGKSQSWIRDLENGRLSAKFSDQTLLRKVLGLNKNH